MAWETKCGKAGGYAEIAVRTAWLACYYPVEYMTAILNSVINKSERITMYLSVCKKKGIQILPPDVNKSREFFTIDGQSIRFGLMGIKNLGKVAQDIIAERDARGEFKDFQDFAERMAIHHKLDRRMLEALIHSGSLDCFEGTRRAKLSIIDQILDYVAEEKQNYQTGQLDLFSFSEDEALTEFKKIKIPNLAEFDKKIKLQKEKEFVGFYVTEHPLDDYVDYFEREGVYEIGFLNHEEDEEGMFEEGEEEEQKEEQKEEEQKTVYSYNGEEVKIAGIIKDLKIFYTKKDQKPLYTFQVEDKTGEMKAVIFSDRIELNQDKLVEGKVVIIQGQIKQDKYGTQIIVQYMLDIESLVNKEKPKAVWVKLTKKEQFEWVTEIVKKHPGHLPVFVYYNGKAYKLNDSMDLNFTTFAQLQELFGENVKVTYHK
jgi:DNA polymerase III subunit alpha